MGSSCEDLKNCGYQSQHNSASFIKIEKTIHQESVNMKETHNSLKNREPATVNGYYIRNG